jgi:hypothetical protein
MALTTWTDRQPASTRFEGLVLKEWVQEDRVMSDVYANCTYILVWDEEKDEPRSIRVQAHFECDPTRARIEVDATPEVVAKWEAHKARQSAIRRLQTARSEVLRDRQRAESEHHNPVKGKVMVVKRSWKEVKRGMEGEVFWVRGNRVGLRTSDAKNDKGNWADVIWCNASQLCNKAEFEHTIPDHLMRNVQDAEAVMAAAEAM